MIGSVASARLTAPTEGVGRSKAAQSQPQPEARKPVADVVTLSAAAQEVGTGSVAHARERTAAAFGGGVSGRIQAAAAAVQDADEADTGEVLATVEEHAEDFSGGSGASVRSAAGIASNVGFTYAGARAFTAYQTIAHGAGTSPLLHAEG